MLQPESQGDLVQLEFGEQCPPLVLVAEIAGLPRVFAGMGRRLCRFPGRTVRLRAGRGGFVPRLAFLFVRLSGKFTAEGSQDFLQGRVVVEALGLALGFAFRFGLVLGFGLGFGLGFWFGLGFRLRFRPDLGADLRRRLFDRLRLGCRRLGRLRRLVGQRFQCVEHRPACAAAHPPVGAFQIFRPDLVDGPAFGALGVHGLSLPGACR